MAAEKKAINQKNIIFRQKKQINVLYYLQVRYSFFRRRKN